MRKYHYSLVCFLSFACIYACGVSGTATNRASSGNVQKELDALNAANAVKNANNSNNAGNTNTVNPNTGIANGAGTPIGLGGTSNGSATGTNGAGTPISMVNDVKVSFIASNQPNAMTVVFQFASPVQVTGLAAQSVDDKTVWYELSCNPPIAQSAQQGGTLWLCANYAFSVKNQKRVLRLTGPSFPNNTLTTEVMIPDTPATVVN